MSSKQSKSQIGMNSNRNPSLESTASVSTATTGKFTSGRTSSDNAMVTTYGQSLYDCVAAIIWCPKHKKMGMSRLIGREVTALWFPVSAVRTGQGWYECTALRVREMLKVPNSTASKAYLSFSPPRLLHVLRLQIPQYYDFISRVIFYTELTHDSKHPTNCCEDSKNMTWISGDELVSRRVRELWGPEPYVFADAVVANKLENIDNYSEFLIKDILKFAPKEPPKTYQEELVKAGGFQEKDIFKLYGEFLQHTYPSQYMTDHSFDDYMTKVGLPQLNAGITADMTSVFRAFGYNNTSFLSFNELLLGLCALDRNTAHGGHTGELRSSYLFRYYNQNGDNQRMDIEDMKIFLKDIIRLKTDGKAVDMEQELKNMYKSIGIGFGDRIDCKLFTKSIGEKKLRGTAGLFRSTVNPLKQILTKRVYESIQLSQISFNTAIDAKLQKVKGSCVRCRQKRYTLAAHSVRLSKDGVIIDPQENKGQSDVQRMAKTVRRHSDQSFLGSTNANVILDTLRAFATSGAIAGLNTSAGNVGANRSEGSNSQYVWTSKQSRLQLVDKILKLCSDCESIFKREQRVVKVCSPVYVLGDIHGNFHDLCIYEKTLWKMGPTCTAPNFLFLGDYVDRGEQSIECILYLFSMKTLSPDKYWLLRGNHELRPVQQTFTFKNECSDKFGAKVGLQLWEAFNKVFDLLPIAAVIDESIFCAHGGIPTSALKIEELLSMPTPMSEPETQCPSAWQMLWNDPVSAQDFRDFQQQIKTQQSGQTVATREGFLPNTKRGTAFYFSEESLQRFLSANQLSHVIRAHEVIPKGYAFHMGGKCITIFSSSKYCNGLNEAAVILVNEEKIRIIIIDTN